MHNVGFSLLLFFFFRNIAILRVLLLQFWIRRDVYGDARASQSLLWCPHDDCAGTH